MVNAIGPKTFGKDFNFYQEEIVTNSDFPSEPQVFMKFRGSRRMIFVCPAGAVEYSFNGNTVHGKVASGEPSEKLDFGTREGDKIWLKGSGTIQVHAWHVGV
jgi:hypothetical protein